MSNFWWLEPGWKQTCCAACGANIWDSGGDPDWGLCHPCFTSHLEDQEREREAYEAEQRELENREMEEHYRKHPHG